VVYLDLRCLLSYTMVYKCAAFGCKSGYTGSDTADKHGDKITLHVFPLYNEELCEKWIRANPRKDFMPTKHSTLCSLHFTPDDFVLERQDSNSTRRKRKSETPLRRRLKDDAVPSVFPNCPPYLSSPAAVSRTTSRATSSSRLCTVLDYFVSQLVSYILFLQQKTCLNLHVKDSLELVDAGVLVAVLPVVVVAVALVYAAVSAKKYYHTLHSVRDMLILFLYFT